MKESQSSYETYILSTNIDYLPTNSSDEDDFVSDEDEVNSADLLKLETVFILALPNGYNAKQVLGCTGITLHTDSDIWWDDNLDISSDYVEAYPFDPPLELLELNKLSLQEFSARSEFTCWSIHWYVNGPFTEYDDMALDDWYLNYYFENNQQMPESEWKNFVWPETILVKTLSFRSTTYTDYPFMLNNVEFVARIMNDSELSKRVLPLHPDDFATLNRDLLSSLLALSSDSSLDALKIQLEKINLGATQGFLLVK
jgi:hypothetical protein